MHEHHGSTSSDDSHLSHSSSTPSSQPHHSPDDEHSTTTKIELPKSADGVNRKRFYDHVSKYQKTDIHSIRCSECPMIMKSLGIEAGLDRFIYCDKCDIYLCSKCRFPGRPACLIGAAFESDEVFTHSSQCSNQAYLVLMN